MIILEREDWLGGRFEFRIDETLADLDPFQAHGAPCFEPPANDRDWEFLFGNDPEEEYQP